MTGVGGVASGRRPENVTAWWGLNSTTAPHAMTAHWPATELRTVAPFGLLPGDQSGCVRPRLSDT